MLVQVESVKALANLERIAAVDGVDGVFFGPADLAASMGLLGKPADPAVQAAVARGHREGDEGRQGGGHAHSDRKLARQYLAQGALFVAVGVDTTLISVKAAESDLRRERRRNSVRQGLVHQADLPLRLGENGGAILRLHFDGQKSVDPLGRHRARFGQFQTTRPA